MYSPSFLTGILLGYFFQIPYHILSSISNNSYEIKEEGPIQYEM